jgi:hypothetical protein
MPVRDRPERVPFYQLVQECGPAFACLFDQGLWAGCGFSNIPLGPLRRMLVQWMQVQIATVTGKAVAIGYS